MTSELEAQLKKIQIVPTAFNDEGEVKKEQFATLTFELHLDSQIQRDELIKLLDILGKEWVKLEIIPQQTMIPIEHTIEVGSIEAAG